MLKQMLAVLCACAVLALAGCSSSRAEYASLNELGVNTEGGTLISSHEDDVRTYLCLTFEDPACRESIEALGWAKLPYTSDQTELIYSTLRDENGAPLFPLIKDGFYYFEDTDPGTPGFTVAVYGINANVLHYCEYRG